MAQVALTNDLGRQFAGGETRLELEVKSVQELVRELERRYPGIGEVLESGSMAVAIDGNIIQDAWFEAIGPDSEVFFLPAIKGG